MNVVKTVAYGLMVLALAAFAGSAYASEASNTNTGPNSENEAMVEVTNDLDIDVDNDADFDADLDLDFGTGGNDVKYNTTAGDNESGAVDVDISGSTEINQESGLCDCLGLEDMFGGDHSASNHTTGPQSDNEAVVHVENDVEVDVDNDADVDLDVDVNAWTGGNETSNNTTAGNTKSGSINFSFSWETVINQGGN